MTYARSDTEKRGWPTAEAVIAPPLRQFAAVAVAFAVCLGMLTTFPFNAGPGPTLVAVAIFLASATLTGRALHLRYPHDRLGMCNVVTLARLAMTASLVGPLVAGAAPYWAVFAVAAIALCLDGIDGWLARRQGHVSDFGGRFDMEVDSALALILALSAAVSSGLGPFAVVLGLPRYVFAIASWALPWMRRELPERFSRKVVCVVQLAVLIALQVPILPATIAVALVALASLALAWSFAVDVIWLWRRRA